MHYSHYRYTLYVVNVVCPAGAAWKLKLRYSEFSSLYLAIKRDCKKTGITFPGKTFGKLSIAQQEKRRLHLKAFLLEITGRADMSSSTREAISSFLRINEHVRGGQRPF
jgi:hypothetical protein